MNWTQLAKDIFVKRGMADYDADAVIAYAMTHQRLAFMKDEWDSRVRDYPAERESEVIARLNAVAREWIRLYKPSAWYGPRFSHFN
jgi:hypothetical protein